MKILVINGPNINMLGIREPDIYGKQTFADLLALLDETARKEGLEISQFQSNHEGAIVDKIQESYGTKNIVTLVVGILCLVTGVGNGIAWLIDLITLITKNRITVLAA